MARALTTISPWRNPHNRSPRRARQRDKHEYTKPFFFHFCLVKSMASESKVSPWHRCMVTAHPKTKGIWLRDARFSPLLSNQ